MKIETVVVAFMHCLCACADTAHISAYVIDEITHAPIPSIKVSASFSNDNGWKAWTESAPIYHDTQETDVNGFCTLKGKTNIGRAGCGVDKQGEKYYGAGGRGFHFTKKNLFGVWQPDNLVATIRLQRVEHPIPLFVKNVRPKVASGTFDGTNAVLRYDLVLGDWLPPEGKGERADLEIRTKLTIDEVLQVGKYKDWKKTFFTFSNTVRFPGEGNGCRAEMTSPTAGIKLRNAPEAGYGKTIVNRFGVKRKIVGPNVNEAEYSDSNPNRCYYFRIRSRFDDKGNLVEAYYGKVYGDFNFHGRWDLGFRGVDFLYYLNPKSLDRNLEWDMKTNLCPTAGRHESQQP
ncbi:MAG: hypothetical protein ACI4UY_13455 [Kiritimatiellia bacterium]